MKTRTYFLTGLFSLFFAIPIGLPAGEMNPPGPPGSTMKSLQEIWDKLEAITAELEALQAHNTAIERHLLALAHFQGMTRDWVTRVFDKRPAAMVGLDCDLVMAPDGHPAIAFRNTTDGNLIYAKYDGSSWIEHTITHSGSIGSSASLAFKADGNPLIACLNDSTDNVMLAEYNGAVWTVRAVTTTGRHRQSCDLIVLAGGAPLIAFEDSTHGLRVALPNALVIGGWEFHTVGPVDDVLHLSLAAPQVSGGPGIACTAGSGGATSSLYYIGLTLKGGTVVGSNKTRVESGLGGSHACSLGFTLAGEPAIAYRHHIQDALKFAWYDGAAWFIEVIDDSDIVGKNCSLAFDPAGNPAVSYYDQGGGGLKFASHDGQEWRLEKVDPLFNAGQGTSLAFTSDWMPAIAHYVGDGYLKYTVLRTQRLGEP
jgi:hypothetical protein